jgi:uncharacterized protein YndB with AHSA1/START domain
VTVVSSIDIERPPGEVFAYVSDLERHREWQQSVLRTTVETPGPTAAGTRAVETRTVGGREHEIPYEVAEHEPPHRLVIRATAGSIRPHVVVSVDGLDDDRRSRVTISLELEGRGLGRLLEPVARQQAQAQLPIDQGRLKTLMERP